MKSQSATVDKYLESLPADRRAVVSKLRALLRRRIPKGFHESMMWGAITYAIPLARFPDTYNKQPLCYVALASKKNYLSLYLMSVYGSGAELQSLREGFKKAGKKLDMGKSCVRFKSLDDLPLDVIGDIVAKITPEKWIAIYEKSRGKTSRARTP